MGHEKMKHDFKKNSGHYFLEARNSIILKEDDKKNEKMIDIKWLVSWSFPVYCFFFFIPLKFQLIIDVLRRFYFSFNVVLAELCCFCEYSLNMH